MENTHSKCMVCESTKLIQMKGYKRAHLVKCSGCGFIFAIKVPLMDEIEANYKVYPREFDVSPITAKRYREWLHDFEQYRITNNILDIGCGSGHFLMEARKMGWNVFGTEYSDEAISYCRKNGINVFKDKAKIDSEITGLFDVVIMLEVIEHFNNPEEEIRFANDILREHGIVYVTTPNFNSIARKILKNQWGNIMYPDHLSYFTKPTLNNIFNKLGFTNIWLNTTGFSWKKYYPTTPEMVQSENNNLPKEELLRSNIEKSIILNTLKKATNFFLTLFNIGDTLKAIYRKE